MVLKLTAAPRALDAEMVTKSYTQTAATAG